MFAAIQRVIEKEAKLAVPATDLTPRADLYRLGLTPYSAVRVLLALERECEVELPRSLLKRETLQTMESIANALRSAQLLRDAA